MRLRNKELHIISQKMIYEAARKHPEAAGSLRTWCKDFKGRKFENYNQVKEFYPSASILENSRICFNIKGNAYRLIAVICSLGGGKS
ncbi:MAG: type II toxin-antitoxin system HigB family toxin [Cryomorphaceae bacterium]